jgi:hypothetical protein
LSRRWTDWASRKSTSCLRIVVAAEFPPFSMASLRVTILTLYPCNHQY